MKRIIIFFVTVLLLFGLVFSVMAQDEELSVPKEKYLIAFSNGEMSNSWRWAFVDSMQAWANEFRKLGPGIDYVWTNAGNDSAKQLMDVENLLAMDPDILILSPNQDEPLDSVIDMATEAGVPLIVVDRSLVRKPGIGTYITNITQNYAMSGAYQAVYALEWLKEHYGEYKGNIVEIQGIIGASATTDQYVGFRSIIKYFPKVKILATAAGGYADVGGRQVMEDFLQKFGPGEIDLVVCHNDAMALGALSAIKDAGRDELLDGRLLGKDQMVEFVEEILNGRALMTTECPPYYGPYAMKTAIKYLNGELKPELMTYLPLRNWENPNDAIDLTPAKNDKEILEKHIKYTKEAGLALIPPEAGDFDGLTIDISGWKGYEDIMEYTRTREISKDIVYLQNK